MSNRGIRFAGNEGNAQALIDWFNNGADGQIDWCSPGDFDDCVSVASAHLDNPEGFCNERHQDACGGPPGSEDHSVRDTATAVGENATMTRVLSRDAIIAQFSHDQAALAASATTDAALATADGGTILQPPAEGEGSPQDAKVDAGMDVLVERLLADIDALETQQAQDPGNGQGLDAQVQAHLDQIKALAGQLKNAQDADSAEGPAAATPSDVVDPPKPAGDSPEPVLPAKAPAMAAGDAPADAPGETPGNADGVPNDADDNGPGPGDIENDVICQNPECGHISNVHSNDVTNGDNTGPCTTPQCTCPGMIPPDTVISSPDDTTGDQTVGEGEGGPDNAGGDDETPLKADGAVPIEAPVDAQPVTPAAPQAPAVEGAPAPQLPPLDPAPNITVGPAFTCPVAWIEGVETGDGRMIQPGAMTWRTVPLPLMGLKTSPHDPSGMSPNDPAVLIGRIEEVEVDGTTGVMRGHLLNTEDGMEFAEIIEQMGRMGVSIDVGAAEVQTTADVVDLPPGGSVFDAPLLDVLVKGEVMGATVCPFAAFANAYIVLGDGSSVPDTTLPPAPEGAKMAIHYVDEAPCVPCGDEPAQLVAAASSPTLLRPPSAWFDNPRFGYDAEGNKIDPRDDPRLVETIDPKTGRPSGKFACPPTITDDGQVFMHIAQFGVCHQSPQFLNNGQCVLAPRSHVDYAAFHGTGSVITAEGERIGVGRMTADTGHASDAASVDFRRALAHYDNSGLTAALVRAGEDEFGIWVAGALHPEASPEQVFTMRSNPPSGDWRPFGAGRELCQVLFVNHPGFPMVVADKRPQTGEITRLVAAGVPCFTMPEDALPALSIEERIARIEAVNGPVLALARDHLRDRRAALRG